MPKRAVSVTLDRDNLLWLNSHASARGRANLSAALDALITEARRAGRVPAESIRSVMGTVDLPADDPWLERAADYVRTRFAASLTRRGESRSTSSRRRHRAARPVRRRG